MKWLPQSLFGRVALILLTGLLLAQLLAAALQFRDRSQRLVNASGVFSAERIAEIVRLLDDVGVTERKRLVSILNVPPLRVSLKQPVWKQSDSMTGNALKVRFQQSLQRQLGQRYAIRVAVSDQPLVGGEHNMRNLNQHNMNHMQAVGMSTPVALIFMAQVKLRDGIWVTFENSIAEEVLADSTSLLVTLGIILGTVLLVSLLAVRWVTRPLSMLADAAEKLGGNINQPALQETGPSEMRHAAKAFNLMQNRLQRFIEDRMRLLTAISHDLKTPITRMRLRSEMLDDSVIRSAFIKNLDEMQAIAAETLDFLRAENLREPLQTLDVCVLFESLRDDAAEIGQVIKIGDCNGIYYHGRPLALKRCISNLISNAIKYAGDAQVTFNNSTEMLEIIVTDTGPGIPDEKLEQVFEPFYRLDSSRGRDTGGTGMGLSIARNIALSHGGELVLSNNPEGGLQASLRLPRTSME